MIASFQELLHQIARLFIWIIVVAPWEQALRVRLGKHVRLFHAGWYIVIPFVDRVYRQSIRRRLTIMASQTLTTADRKPLVVSAQVGYTIADLRKLYDTLHDAEGTICATVAAQIAGYVSSHPLSECCAESIEQHVRGKLTLAQYGLGDQEFYVTNFAATRTYRFITGEIQCWTQDRLNTSAFDGART